MSSRGVSCVAYLKLYSLVASLINSIAKPLLAAFSETDNAHPPYTVECPGSCPFWVGKGAKSIASSHSGQGAFPSSPQFPGIQLPSSAIPTTPFDINSVEIFAPACPVIAQLKLAPRSSL